MTVPHHLAKTEQRQAEVGKRGKVARRAKRALAEHYGKDVGVIEVYETLHCGELHTRVAIRKRLDFEQEHQTHYLRSHSLAKAAGMRHNEVFLELREALAVNGDVAQRAKPGGDAVDRFGLRFHLLIKIFATFFNALCGIIRERQ